MSNSQQFFSRGRVVAQKAWLAQRIHSASGKTIFDVFEHELLWLFETQTTVVFSYNGKKLKDSSTHNDYYGFMNSIEQAKDAAIKQVQLYDLNSTSPLVIELYTELIKKPVKLDSSARPIGNNIAYLGAFDKSQQCFYHDGQAIDKYLAEADRFNAWTHIEPLHVCEAQVFKNFLVGNSKEGFEQQRQALESLIEFSMNEVSTMATEPKKITL